MACVLLGDRRTIEALAWSEGMTIAVGCCGVASIRVVSVSGQGALVPWFEVEMSDGRRMRYNGAYVQSVRYVAEVQDGE